MGIGVKLLVGFLLVALIPIDSFALMTGPARYTLLGSGSGSIDGVAFRQEVWVWRGGGSHSVLAVGV